MLEAGRISAGAFLEGHSEGGVIERLAQIVGTANVHGSRKGPVGTTLAGVPGRVQAGPVVEDERVGERNVRRTGITTHLDWSREGVPMIARDRDECRESGSLALP